MALGRPPIYDSPEKMQADIDIYFSTVSKATITGLCLALGFESRQSFYDYEEKEDFSYIVKRARLRIENYYELNLTENNVTGSIFALKNMGWKDKSEMDMNGTFGINWHEEKTYQSK